MVEQVLIALALCFKLARDAPKAIPHRGMNPAGQPSTRRIGLLSAPIPVVHQVKVAPGVGKERPHDANVPPSPSRPDTCLAALDFLRGEQSQSHAG